MMYNWNVLLGKVIDIRDLRIALFTMHGNCELTYEPQPCPRKNTEQRHQVQSLFLAYPAFSDWTLALSLDCETKNKTKKKVCMKTYDISVY